MSIAVAQPVTCEPKSSPGTPRAEQRIILNGISWETYERLVDEIESGGIRLNYDRGSLEIMSPSLWHETQKKLIGRMIEILVEELDLPIRSGGSTTFRLEEDQSGLEADECYWLANAPAVTHKKEIDLTQDAPPDLAIEVDMTSNSLVKTSIYSAIGIPEVWRYDGESIQVMKLGDDGRYATVAQSPSLPMVPLADLVRFLDLQSELDERQWVKVFRKWVREEVAG